MWPILASSVDNLVMASVHIACKIITRPKVIPNGLGGIDYTRGGALEVPVVSIYEVSICTLASIASAIPALLYC